MNGALPKVFAIILNYNGGAQVLNALRALYRSDYKNFEVVLVDNASTDGSFEEARRLFPAAHAVHNSDNLGFARGMNLGIRFALTQGADYVWLLNNDAWVESETLPRLMEAAESEGERAIFSPLILNSLAQIWFAGGTVDWRRMRTFHSVPRQELEDGKPYESEYLTGCALLIPAGAIREVGLLDEGYFLYYEDADFSLRAKNKGYTLRIMPHAIVRHHEQSVNNPTKTYWLVRSGIRFFRQHAGWRRLWYLVYYPLRQLKNLYDVVVLRNTAAQEVRRAYRDAGWIF